MMPSTKTLLLTYCHMSRTSCSLPLMGRAAVRTTLGALNLIAVMTAKACSEKCPSAYVVVKSGAESRLWMMETIG